MIYIQIQIDGHWVDQILIEKCITRNQLDKLLLSWAKSLKVSTAGLTYSFLQLPDKKPKLSEMAR